MIFSFTIIAVILIMCVYCWIYSVSREVEVEDGVEVEDRVR